MTDPDHPLPQSGGSFVRHEDGSLTPAAAETEAPAEEVIPPKPAVKGPSKAPVKES